jgi:general secretion pathway protein N
MTSLSIPKNFNKKTWIITGVVLFFVFTLSQIPAQWGAYLLTRGTGLALSGITGSVWNGRASLASVKLEGRDYSLGQLSWNLNLLSLISFNPCAKLTTKLDAQAFDGDVCKMGAGVKLQNANVSLPAVMLQSQIPIPIGGQFSAHFDELQLQGNVLMKLKGNFSWTSAQVNNGANWMDIGSYAAELNDNGHNGVKAKVFQLAGPVDVDLMVELTAPSGGQVQGSLATPKAFVEASNAAGLLAMFAREDSVDDQGKTHYLVDIAL